MESPPRPLSTRPLTRRGGIALLTATLAAILSLLALPACDSTDDRPADAPPTPGQLTIIATTGMVADVARNIAGDRANVSALLGPGVDPHLYKPTRSDIATLSRADVIFSSGLMLEGKMTEVLDRLKAGGRRMHPVAELVDVEYLAEESDDSSPPGSPTPPAHDPHLWMDPLAWLQVAEVIRDKLIEADPEGADIYTANAERYFSELRALHEYASEVLATVPERSRILITAHDAFGYFGRRYGYQVEGIQGISTESEAGVRDIQRLVDLIAENDVRAVFIETTVADRNIRALIAGAAARGRTVQIGGELFSDAMGPANTYEGTYIGMIDHNVTTITRALGGDAPARGMQEKLAVR